MSNRTKSPKIFIANLSSRVNKSELEEKFEKYGKIIDINLRDGRDRDRFAFIEYDDVRDAEDAVDKLQSYELHGRKIRIEFAHGGRRERNDNAAKEGTNCFVCGQRGHWASDCPNGAQQGIKKGTCFVCGSTSHKMRNCPKKKDNSRSRSGSRSRSDSRRRHRKGGRGRRDRSDSRDRSEDRHRRHSHRRRSDSRDQRRRSRSSRSSRGSRGGSPVKDKRRGGSRSGSRSRSSQSK